MIRQPKEDRKMTANNTPKQSPGTAMTIPLAQGTELDLSFLPEAQRQTLLTQYAEKVLDISVKAAELGVEASVLRKTLETLAGTIKEVADSGSSVTIKHEHKTPSGRTEFVGGNTPEATKGKTGLNFGGDMRTLYVIGGLIALVVVIAIMFGR
jgi:hypothetical protein